MVISDGLEGSGGAEIDCSVGTIVWVRRRNGSWWPGKILGPDELSDSHLVSPRSGTPVKLLGREDASVDWYNLEKSKRVKAFRCGEFDDCIERAESSQGAPIKKREKYARREDAILHALELEKQLYDKGQHTLGGPNHTNSKLPIGLKRDLASPAGSLGNNNGNFSTPKKSQSYSKGHDSSGDESRETPSPDTKHGKQLSWKDANGEATPRVRGLKDFGLRTGKTKRKLAASISSEDPRGSFSVENHVNVLPGSRSMKGTGRASGRKSSMSLKKRSTEGVKIKDYPLKKRDRRRALDQVLKSSAMLTVSNSSQTNGASTVLMGGAKGLTGTIARAKRSQCVYLPAVSNDSLENASIPSDQKQVSPSQFAAGSHLHSDSSTEDNTSSGFMEAAESDSSETHLSLDMDDETAVFSDSTPILADGRPTKYGNFVGNYQLQGKRENIGNDELDQSEFTRMPHFHPRERTGADTSDGGVSKWQQKGKRNIRNLPTKPLEMDGTDPEGLIKGTHVEGKGSYRSNQRAMRQSSYRRNEDFTYDYDEVDEVYGDMMQDQGFGYDNGKYPSMLKTKTDDIDSDEDLVWDVNGFHQQPSFKRQLAESEEFPDPLYLGRRSGNGKNPKWVEVDLKVQSSYQGEHVPLVSLMSKLDGKAIIGHPVQIESLEDGSSNLFLSIYGDFEEDLIENDGIAALTPVWSTARRTVMHRVPRPHPSKSKSLEKKLSKKLPKKVSLSNQKTRTLSSIATQQKLSKAANQKTVNRLIKPETEPTTTRCIPVQLVFSRLAEGLGKFPSRALNPNAPSGDNKEHRPS